MLSQNQNVQFKMIQKMLAAHNLVSQYITPEMKILLGKLEFEVIGSQLDQNLCFDNYHGQSNGIILKKKRKKSIPETSYSSTKVKALSFLTNISYRRLKIRQ